MAHVPNPQTVIVEFSEEDRLRVDKLTEVLTRFNESRKFEIHNHKVMTPDEMRDQIERGRADGSLS